MLTSILELFKLGIGPSSSHTNGPMIAANQFINEVTATLASNRGRVLKLYCVLTGSLAYTGRGHGTDTAIVLGLRGYTPKTSAELSLRQGFPATVKLLKEEKWFTVMPGYKISFDVNNDLVFDLTRVYSEHPNGLVFQLKSVNSDASESVLLERVYFSVGGGFVKTRDQFKASNKQVLQEESHFPFKFSNAKDLLFIAREARVNFAQIQLENELVKCSYTKVSEHIGLVSQGMFSCIARGLSVDGVLPGGLGVSRRAKTLFEDIQKEPSKATVNDWLCAYAMAVNEENASGYAVVTAPTNGAAGVVPAVLYYLVKHMNVDDSQVQEFLLTATIIGSLIKNGGSISGAEVGCQGEIGAASAMAAAGCCAVLGGTVQQVENAAEIALEHHLGMTCDPVAGLVQVPCIERNGFGAIKAFAAASLSLHGDGEHLISLDSCIAAMKQTGEEMSIKFKETSQGGLAVKWVDC